MFSIIFLFLKTVVVIMWAQRRKSAIRKLVNAFVVKDLVVLCVINVYLAITTIPIACLAIVLQLVVLPLLVTILANVIVCPILLASSVRCVVLATSAIQIAYVSIYLIFICNKSFNLF